MLVKGYILSNTESMSEVLMAVLSDGRVYQTDYIALPNPYFNTPNRKWRDAGVTSDWVVRNCKFCGNYDVPEYKFR